MDNFKIFQLLTTLLVYAGCLYLIMDNSHWESLDIAMSAVVLSICTLGYVVLIFLTQSNKTA